MGDVEFASGDADTAKDYYETAVSQLWNRDLAVRLARVYRVNEPNRANAVLLRWLRDNPDDTPVRLIYAQQLENHGEVADAVREYERINLTTQDPIVLNNLAWQYAVSGTEGAARLAAMAHKLAPDNGSITDTYGWILYRQGVTDRALPLLEEAARQSQDNHEIQFHLATVLAESGNKEKASRILERLLESDRPFPSRKDAQALAATL
jgi:uncharacterized protein (TIGR02996 family)